MDWDALMQRLWIVIESRGFEAFSARLRSALPDRSCEVLAQAVQCLFASGHSDVAQSLLGEFLSHHAYSNGIKRRLQMLLLFETRYAPEGYGIPSDVESIMAEVRHLLDSNSFDRATKLILDALEMCEDPDLLELLGRVQALQHASGKGTENVSPRTTASIATASQDLGDHSRDEVDDLDFIWQETSFSTQQAHDSECVKAAETVQAVISASIPKAPDAIEWLVELDDDSDAPFLEARDSTPVIANEKAAPAARLPSFPSEWQSDDHAQSASFPRVITAKKRSKFYQQEQQALAFVQAHPACSVEDLAAALALPMELASHLVATLQTDWIEKDRKGQLTIMQKFHVPSAESESVSDDRDGAGAISSHPEGAAPASRDSASEPDADIAAKCASLPERSRQLLLYVLERPGQKTSTVAEELGFSLAVVHSLLNGGLAEYLECTNFVIYPRPDIAAALKGCQLEPLHPAPVPKDHRTMASTAISTLGRDSPDDLDVTPADIARAAKLSRLSPSSKTLLALLYAERQALSKHLAQKLGLESEQVNQALLGALSEHVTVKHSFWRLDERVVPALRLAGII